MDLSRLWLWGHGAEQNGLGAGGIMAGLSAAAAAGSTAATPHGSPVTANKDPGCATDGAAAAVANSLLICRGAQSIFVVR